MTILLLIIHVIVSGALIMLILLHSGRGGGLSEMFGSGLGSAAAGSTVVERKCGGIGPAPDPDSALKASISNGSLGTLLGIVSLLIAVTPR